MKVPEKAWLFLFVGLGAAMLVFTLVGEKSLYEVRRMGKERDKLKAEISNLWNRKHSMEKEIENLRDNPTAIEDRARRELGMIRKGETVFNISGVNEARK